MLDRITALVTGPLGGTIEVPSPSAKMQMEIRGFQEDRDAMASRSRRSE
jgi:hypothetical protein